MPAHTGHGSMAELDKEARMGAMGSETHAREIRRIDLSDFERRQPDRERDQRPLQPGAAQ